MHIHKLKISFYSFYCIIETDYSRENGKTPSRFLLSSISQMCINVLNSVLLNVTIFTIQLKLSAMSFSSHATNL